MVDKYFHLYLNQSKLKITIKCVFRYLVGSFLGGILYDKFNKILILALSSLCIGLTVTVTPFCSTLPWMLAIKFAGGASCGAFDVGKKLINTLIDN